MFLIYKYTNIDGNLGGTFTLLDSAFDSIYEPSRVSLARFDIDNDSYPDLVTGNFCGGIRFYTHFNTVGINTTQVVEAEPFDIFPNPATVSLTILFKKVLKNKLVRFSIIDVAGRTLQSGIITADKNATIPIESIAKGFYLIHFFIDGNLYIKNIIKE